jgi:hypothetical protein
VGALSPVLNQNPFSNVCCLILIFNGSLIVSIVLVPQACLQDRLALPIDDLKLGDFAGCFEFHAKPVKPFDLGHHDGRETVPHCGSWEPLTSQLSAENDHCSPFVEGRAHMYNSSSGFQP